MAINVSGIKEYIDESRLPLIRKSATGAPTLNYIEKMYGVKGKTTLNLLETAVTFGDGTKCGFQDEGESTLSQRTIEPAIIKVNKKFCDMDLQKYFLNKEVQIVAGGAKLPAEQEFVNDVIDGTVEGLEKFVWNEDNVIGSAHFKGFLGLKSEMTQAVKGATVYASTKAVYRAIPADSIRNSVIFMGQDSFRDLVMELTEKNLYHYDPKIDESWEIVLPGTVTKVVGVPGLDGKKAIISLNTKHAFYATDLEGSEEVLKAWYSDDDQDFKMLIKFAAGVQVAFPKENVYCNLGE